MANIFKPILKKKVNEPHPNQSATISFRCVPPFNPFDSHLGETRTQLPPVDQVQDRCDMTVL